LCYRLALGQAVLVAARLGLSRHLLLAQLAVPLAVRQAAIMGVIVLVCWLAL
jgi:hypothetical protein